MAAERRAEDCWVVAHTGKLNPNDGAGVRLEASEFLSPESMAGLSMTAVSQTSCFAWPRE